MFEYWFWAQNILKSIFYSTSSIVSNCAVQSCNEDSSKIFRRALRRIYYTRTSVTSSGSSWDSGSVTHRKIIFRCVTHRQKVFRKVTHRQKI